MTDDTTTHMVAYVNKQLDRKNARIEELEKREQEYLRELDLKDAWIRDLQAEIATTHPPQGRVHSIAIARTLLHRRPTSPETAA